MAQPPVEKTTLKYDTIGDLIEWIELSTSPAAIKPIYTYYYGDSYISPSPVEDLGVFKSYHLADTVSGKGVESVSYHDQVYKRLDVVPSDLTDLYSQFLSVPSSIVSESGYPIFPVSGAIYYTLLRDSIVVLENMSPQEVAFTLGISNGYARHLRSDTLETMRYELANRQVEEVSPGIFPLGKGKYLVVGVNTCKINSGRARLRRKLPVRDIKPHVLGEDCDATCDNLSGELWSDTLAGFLHRRGGRDLYHIIIEQEFFSHAEMREIVRQLEAMYAYYDDKNILFLSKSAGGNDTGAILGVPLNDADIVSQYSDIVFAISDVLSKASLRENPFDLFISFGSDPHPWHGSYIPWADTNTAAITGLLNEIKAINGKVFVSGAACSKEFWQGAMESGIVKQYTPYVFGAKFANIRQGYDIVHRLPAGFIDLYQALYKISVKDLSVMFGVTYDRIAPQGRDKTMESAPLIAYKEKVGWVVSTTREFVYDYKPRFVPQRHGMRVIREGEHFLILGSSVEDLFNGKFHKRTGMDDIGAGIQTAESLPAHTTDDELPF